MEIIQIPAEPTSEPRISQADAVRDRFLNSYRDGKTRTAYSRDLENWFQYCDGTGLDAMRARRIHVEDWVRQFETTPTYLGQPPKPATVHRITCVVRRFYGYAMEHEILDRNPVPSAKSLNLAKVPSVSTTHSLTKEEANRFLEAAKLRGARDAAIVAVLLYQAVRVGELCSLDVESLSSEESHRTVTFQLKGGDIHVAALAPSVAAYVDRWLACQSNPDASASLMRKSGADARRTPLFVGSDGDRIKYWHVEQVIRACAKAAGISKKLSPHSMRHTCITHALSVGVSLRDVQVLAGHKHPSTTIRYDRRRLNLNSSPVYKINGDFG